MSLLAVKWYEYRGQSPAWQQFWQDLSAYVPLSQPLKFYENLGADLWPAGAFDLTWACGGDMALNPEWLFPVAVPHFIGAATPAGMYQSVILRHQTCQQVPVKDLRIGINQPQSVSGHLALAHWWNQQGYPRPKQVQLTGGHEGSIRSLLNREVDLICLDAQGWPLLRQAYPALCDQAAVMATTATLPAPPLCLPAKGGLDQLADWQSGFRQADAALKSGRLRAPGLGLAGLHPVQLDKYRDLGKRLRQQIHQGCLLYPMP